MPRLRSPLHHLRAVSYTHLAEQRAKLADIPQLVPACFVGLSVEPAVLNARIDVRVDGMFDAGLVDEVARLLQGGFRDGITAPQAIGYKEVVAALDGETTMEEAATRIKTATHRYAKRQRTWFRKDRRIRWIDANEPDVAAQAAEEMCIRDRRMREVRAAENRVSQREESLDRRVESLDAREHQISSQQGQLDRRERDLEEAAREINRRLERVAGMTPEEAKAELLDTLKDEVVHESAAIIRDSEARTKAEADKKARSILSLAIQRVAADHSAENTVSAIHIPSDDLKGRIIGREGRNIQMCIRDSIGLGDLLLSKPEYAKPQRIQGCYVSEDEINAVVELLKAQGEPEYHSEILQTNLITLGASQPDGSGGSCTSCLLYTSRCV